MAGMNFRKPNGFDEDGGGTEGGLLGMVQRAMQEQGTSSATVFKPTASGFFGYNSEDDSQPRGLLGRLLALQAEQNLQSSLAITSRSISPRPADSSFAQVSPAFKLERAVGSDGLSDDQSRLPNQSIEMVRRVAHLGSTPRYQQQFLPFRTGGGVVGQSCNYFPESYLA